MERDVTRRHSKTMNIKKTLPAVAGFFIASAAFAAEQFLPTPPPSEFVDAESSVNVPLPTTEGRHINLTLAFEPTPSNAVQVAFGHDLNADGDLAPEETHLVLGIDCGAWFIQDELGRWASRPSGDDTLGRWASRPSGTFIGERASCPFVLDVACESSDEPSPVWNCRFHIRQAQVVADRWALAKVTTHNLADTNLTVIADFYTKGMKLILR